MNEAYVIVLGNVATGITLYGLYSDAAEAIETAHYNVDPDTEWLVMPVHSPDDL
jgi:hypothetical protein